MLCIRRTMMTHQGVQELNRVHVVVAVTTKFGNAGSTVMQVLMSVGESRRKGDCVFVAWATIIIIIITKFPAPKRAFQQVITSHMLQTIYIYIHPL